MSTTLKFIITNNLVEFLLIDNENENELNFKINHQSSFLLDIQFDENTFKVCTGNEEGRKGLITNFVSEVFEHPENYTTYKIQFNGKEYELTGECLLAIVLKELIETASKETKFDQIEVEIVNENETVSTIAYLRIKNALKFLENENLEIYRTVEDNETEEDENYEETISLIHEEMKQKEYFNEIIHLNLSVKERNKRIQQTIDESLINFNSYKELNRKDGEECDLHYIIDELNQLKRSNYLSEIEEKKSLSDIIRSCNPEELPLSLKRKYHYNKLDQYTMFLAMMYFETLDDMINVIFASKRFKHILAKFHFNPVSLNETTIEFFPSIETLRLYSSEDKKIVKKRIHTYELHYPIPLQKKEEYEQKGFVCKEFQINKPSQKMLNCKQTPIVAWGDKMYAYDKLLSISIPEQIKELNDYCFLQCTNLTKVNLPTGLRKIGKGCFDNCHHLKQIILPTTVTHIEEDSFRGCVSLTVIMSSQMTKLINKIKTQWNRFDLQKEIVWNENSTTSSFSFKSITNVVIPEGYSSLDSSTFFYPDCIHSIQLPTSLVRLENKCFQNWNSLRSLTIPTSVTSIGEYCFSKFPIYKSFNLPTNLNKIPSGNFYFMEHLKKIEIPENVTSIEDHCFYICSSLKTIHLSSQLKTIGNYCFFDCSHLFTIDLPESLESIGSCCFYKLENIKQIIIPKNVTELKENCFVNLNSLTKIELPSSLQRIENNCFYGLTALQEIIIPQNVTSIGDKCFMNCPLLSKIEYLNPNIVVGFDCYRNCPSLKLSGIIYRND